MSESQAVTDTGRAVRYAQPTLRTSWELRLFLLGFRSMAALARLTKKILLCFPLLSISNQQVAMQRSISSLKAYADSLSQDFGIPGSALSFVAL